MKITPSFYEYAQNIISTYSKNEQLAEENYSIYLRRCFKPHNFLFSNFQTYLNSAKELWKVADSMQEFILNNSQIKNFSDEELRLIKNISLDIGRITKDFNRRTIPIGINHQLSSLPTIRILQHLKKIDDKFDSVLEIGGGSGMLGHMLHRLGFKYSNFDITQSFYVYNSTIFKYLYKDKFTDYLSINIDNLNSQKKLIDNSVTLFPWWNFVNPEFPIPKFKVLVMNHCFFEIPRKTLTYIFRRLADVCEERCYLIISGLGSREYSDLDDSFLKWLEKEFNFQKEVIPASSEIISVGSVLLSFQKIKSSKTYINSLTLEKRLSKFKVEKIKKNRSRFINFLSKKFPKKIKKLVHKILELNKDDIDHVFNYKQSYNSENFDKTIYTKYIDDFIKLLSEIESELGKPSFTEDEELGYYINRSEHV